MKYVILLFIFISFSCACRKQTNKTFSEKRFDPFKNALLSRKVIITHLYTYQRNKELAHWTQGFDTKKFTKDIINKVLYNNYKAYDSFDTAKLISHEQLEVNLGIESDTVFVEDTVTKEIIPKIIKSGLDYSQIRDLVFEEEWFFDQEKFEMQKRVINWSPVRYFYKNIEGIDHLLRTKTFTIKNVHKSAEKYRILAKNIIYEFDLEDTLGLEWLKALNTLRFVRILIDNVLSGRIAAYDPSNPKKKLKIQEIKKILDAVRHVKYVENLETEEMEQIIIPETLKYEEIKSVIFIENWYINDNTLSLQKEILGIAPVRHYYIDSDIYMKDKIKKIVFVVYFTKKHIRVL